MNSLFTVRMLFFFFNFENAAVNLNFGKIFSCLVRNGFLFIRGMVATTITVWKHWRLQMLGPAASGEVVGEWCQSRLLHVANEMADAVSAHATTCGCTFDLWKVGGIEKVLQCEIMFGQVKESVS